MPDTTVNRGYRIPKSDGTDVIQPDDIRVPVTSIDTDMNTVMLAQAFKTGELNAIVGTPPTAGTPRVSYSFTTTCVIAAGGLGLFTINWPAAFAHGITYIGLTCGDNAAGLTQIVVDATVCTLSVLHGKAYRADGSPVPSASTIRVNVHVVGW